MMYKKPSKKKCLIIYYGVYPENRGIAQISSNLTFLNVEVQIAARKPEDAKNIHNLHYIDEKFGKPSIFNWYRFINSILKEKHIDVILCREIPLFIPLLFLKFKFKFKLIMDIRENLAGMYKANYKKNIFRLIIAHLLVPIISELTVLFSDVVTLSSPLLRRLFFLRHFPTFNKKIFVIPNTPNKEFIAICNKEINLTRQRKNKNTKIKVVFSGFIREDRGLDHLLNAFSLLNQNEKNNFEFHILGDGPYLNEIKESVNRLNINVYFYFYGMLEPEEAVSVMCSCDYGYMGYEKNQNSNMTYPGKIFEYLFSGLHIISSQRASLKSLSIDTEFISFFSNTGELLYILRNAQKKMAIQDKHKTFKYAEARFSFKNNLMQLESIINSL